MNQIRTLVKLSWFLSKNNTKLLGQQNGEILTNYTKLKSKAQWEATLKQTIKNKVLGLLFTVTTTPKNTVEHSHLIKFDSKLYFIEQNKLVKC